MTKRNKLDHILNYNKKKQVRSYTQLQQKETS